MSGRISRGVGGADGEIFELRKVNTKTTKSKGLYSGAVNISRDLYSLNGKNNSGGGSNTIAIGKGESELRRWRRNGHHGWRQCHLHWGAALAFGNGSKTQTKRDQDWTGHRRQK